MWLRAAVPPEVLFGIGSEGRSRFFAICLRVDDLGVGGATGEAALLGGEFEGLFAVELGLVHKFFDAGGEGLRGVGMRTSFAGVGGADQQGDFAAGGAFFEGGGDFGKFAAEKLFVELGDFAGEAGGAVAENFAGVGDGFSDAVRGLESRQKEILHWAGRRRRGKRAVRRDREWARRESCGGDTG